MKTNFKRKVLSFLLAVVMMVSLTPEKAYAAQVASIELNVDWSNLGFEEGKNYVSFDSYTHMTYSGKGVRYAYAYYVVKVDENWLVETNGNYYLGRANSVINDALANDNGWADLDDFMSCRNSGGMPYTINSSDLYGLHFEVSADTDYNYRFAQTDGKYTGEVNTNIPNWNPDWTRVITIEYPDECLIIDVPFKTGDLASMVPTCDHATKTPVEGTPATCTNNGTIAHSVCDGCGKFFDANGAEIADVTIPAGHTTTPVDREAPTCSTEGKEAHYKCTACGKLFSDSQGTTGITAPGTIPVDSRAHVYSVLRSNEKGHWYECSLCGAADREEYDDKELHTDANSDNKCDLCEHVVYHVAVNADNYTYYDEETDTDSRVYAVQICGADNRAFQYIYSWRSGTFLVPAGCSVVVYGTETMNDALAPGARVELVNGEGTPNSACKAYDFTCNTAIVLNPNPGEVEVDTNVDTQAPIQDVEIKNEMAEFIEAGIFEANEIARILAGEDARVWLDVNELATVPNDDKTAMEGKVAELGASENITYFDASFFKQVGSDTPQSVSEPGMDIEITIPIPQNLLNTDTAKTRTYQLLRYHDGEGVTVIDGSFSNGKFTFTTNKFSTYAIIYTDTAVENEVVENEVVENTSDNSSLLLYLAGSKGSAISPKTGDAGSMFAVAAMMLSAGVMVMMRRKEEK